jgi:hypothetical protein
VTKKYPKPVVVKRKRRRKAKVAISQARGLQDPSHASEIAPCPVGFERVSYSRALTAKPLWQNVPLRVFQLQTFFGEPTRAYHGTLEWVLRILPSKHIVKIAITPTSTDVCGWEKTPALEKWVERLAAGS